MIMNSGRLKGTFTAIKASAALFAAIFVLLAVQMLLGHDPAIGTTREPTAKAAVTEQEPEELSLLDRATNALDMQSPSEDEAEQYYEQEPQPQTQAPAPAPVQSGAS
jgi:hypothetical protein